MYGYGQWYRSRAVELSEYTLDALLALLTAGVQLVAVAVAAHAMHTGGATAVAQQAAATTGTSTAGQAPGSGTLVTAGLLVGVIFLDTILLIGLYRLYQRLPERWQTRVKYAAIAALYLAGTTLVYHFAGPKVAAVALVGALLFDRVPRLLSNNLMGAVVAVFWATVLGLLFRPAILLVLFVSLIAYDFIAVHRSGHMLPLAEAAVEWELPALIVLPKRLPFDWDDLRAAIRDRERIDGVVLGVGDLVFPAALTVSAAVHLPATSIVAGAPVSPVWFPTLCGAISATWIMRTGWLTTEWAAGLPFLNTGAMIGYGLGVLAVGLSGAAALGGAVEVPL